MHVSLDSYQTQLNAEFVAQLRAVRKDYGRLAVNEVVEKFAWEQAQKYCTREKVADPRWPQQGPAFIRYLLLNEILLCNEAKKGLKRGGRR